MATKAIFQLRVTLRDIDPPIWRSVQVPAETKLSDLHAVLQILFNWENYHLHDFLDGDFVYSIPDPEEDAFLERKVRDEKLVALNRVLRNVGGRFAYLYDFGDGWQHDLLLEAILLPDPEAFYPRCVAGARNGPPEDAGGPFGYAEYLKALASRRHPEHKEMLAWRGRWDAEAFSVEAVNLRLRREFRPRGPKRVARKMSDPA